MLKYLLKITLGRKKYCCLLDPVYLESNPSSLFICTEGEEQLISRPDLETRVQGAEKHSVDIQAGEKLLFSEYVNVLTRTYVQVE